MDKTTQNLMDAFAGESQAHQKYSVFASVADKEGHPRVARLFRAAAHAETVHARNHFKAAKKIGSTADNLKAAIEGETYEFEQMYPPMIEQAKKDGNRPAEISLSGANAVEKEHAGFYKTALSTLDKDKQAADTKYFVCEVCGHTCEDHAPDRCPVCNAPTKSFTEIK